MLYSPVSSIWKLLVAHRTKSKLLSGCPQHPSVPFLSPHFISLCLYRCPVLQPGITLYHFPNVPSSLLSGFLQVFPPLLGNSFYYPALIIQLTHLLQEASDNCLKPYCSLCVSTLTSTDLHFCTYHL